MPYPMIAAKCDERTLWVYGATNNSLAVITEGDGEPDEKLAKPLQVLIAHLDLEEWDWEPWKKLRAEKS